MKFAILLTGHVRHGLNYNNVSKIINEISKNGECDIYGYVPDKKEHSTKTWHNIDINLQNENISYEQLQKFMTFKNLVLYKQEDYIKESIDVLWGNSPLSFVGVKLSYLGIYKCLKMLENKYDLVFRLRFDYYKFDYAKYTESIVDILSKNCYNYNSFNCIKVGNQRGEDSFFFSNQENFTKILDYIVENFDVIETYAKNLNYYFMPEDILHYSCSQQNIDFKILGNN